MQINRPQCSHSVDKFSILNGVQVFLCQLLLILIGIHLSIYPSIHPFIHLSILFVAYVFSFFLPVCLSDFILIIILACYPLHAFIYTNSLRSPLLSCLGFCLGTKPDTQTSFGFGFGIWDLAIKRLVVWRVRLPPRGVLWAQPRKQKKKKKKKTHSKPKHNPLPPPQIQDVIRTVEWDLRTYEYKLLGSPVA